MKTNSLKKSNFQLFNGNSRQTEEIFEKEGNQGATDTL